MTGSSTIYQHLSVPSHYRGFLRRQKDDLYKAVNKLSDVCGCALYPVHIVPYSNFGLH